jgi:hypothetical protein
VNICGIITGMPEADPETASATYFWKKTIERLFGKMKQLPSIFPSEQYFCATCLRNGIISIGFVCKDKARMCHIISQSRNYFKKIPDEILTNL